MTQSFGQPGHAEQTDLPMTMPAPERADTMHVADDLNHIKDEKRDQFKHVLEAGQPLAA
jgi:hypothetical protein